MPRAAGFGIVAMLAVSPMGPAYPHQDRPVRELIAELAAANPVVRARAACDLRDRADNAVAAIPALISTLGDRASVESRVCERNWWRGSEDDLVSPGELAASALVAIGSRAFEPLLETLANPAWIARRNAAWALGALDDKRATSAVIGVLQDREPDVRAQAAWALGAIDDRRAVEPLLPLLKDADDRVRRQAAWALGALDDPRATTALSEAIGDGDEGTRAQAAWALGAIGHRDGVPSLVRALKDPAARVRQQAAWALGVIEK